jgi:2-dehydropantoate 2-reductase
MNPSPPVTVVGAGGIGCALGYLLLRVGVPVTFVDADAEKLAWGREHGVAVEGRPPLPARFESFADWTPRPGDSVLLCTKCYDNAAVLARLGPDAVVLPVQNGFDPYLHARGNPVEGIASFVSECRPHRPITRITRPGRLHLGHRLPAGGPLPAWLPALDRAARADGRVRVEVVPDVLPYKYTKLLYNAAISPLAAAAGIDNGRLLSVPAARRLFFALLRENYAILRGAGIPLATIGPFHPDTVMAILRRPLVAGALAWAFYPTLRGTYCSMSGDLPRGRTEIDYYNGHLLGLAGQTPCPLNRRVVDLVKAMERERVPPGMTVLERLAA